MVNKTARLDIRPTDSWLTQGEEFIGYWGGDYVEEPVTVTIGGYVFGVFPYSRKEI
jgi:hypothetical protein